MALNKVYNGTSVTATATTVGDYSAADNWIAIWLVASGYQWTASGGGTNEYYLEANGGGDPGISTPGNIQINGTTNATEGTAGSLAAGEWDYGDNDTLGYSTVYVRLSDGTDPDTKADGYITMTQIPVAGDDVTIPAGAQPISSGLDQSGVAVNAFVFEPGYSGAIGSDTEYFRIDPDSFEYNGTGLAFIDIGSANIDTVVSRTRGASGNRPAGLFLKGSNIDEVITLAGTSVAVAGLANDTATVATWRNLGGYIYSGDGLSLTTLNMDGGSGTLRWTSAITTVTQRGGTLRTKGAGTVTTYNLDGGTLVYDHGNTTTLNQDGGTLDLTKLTSARTISTLNVAPSQRITQRVGPLATITTDNKPSDPYVRTYERIQ